MTALSSKDFIRLASAVPEKKLRLILLAQSLIKADGTLDFKAAQSRQPELHLACAEARAYVTDVRTVLNALKKIKPVHGGAL